ncbi:MAG: tetratricopeptide repeat protein [Bacteroidales bacterium]
MDNRGEIAKNIEKEEKNLQVGNIISRTEVFIDKNKKIIIGIVVAVLVIAATILLYNSWYIPSQEKNAENEIFAAQQYFAQEDYAKALNGDGKHQGLIAISENYSSTKQGRLAKYYVGIIYMKQGKFNDAIKYLEGFKPDDKFMPSQIRSLIGDCYWELNNLDEAISNYKKAAEKNPNNFTTPVILMKLGAAYEVKKDFQKALDCYTQLKKDYPRSPEYSQVEKYIARMETILNK